jgi:4-amino-4-deoxy-L-arabinose transferase-like glycosyltransferase
LPVVQSGPTTGDDARESEPRILEIVAVAGAVVAGVFLRFWTRSHLWLDEALSVDIARLPIGDIPGALRRDGHPPLYYFLLHEWMALFGDGDTAVRSLSGVFALLALPLAWFAGKRAGGRITGLAFVALVSLSPFALRYATETRMYSLVMLLVLAGYLLVANALERTSWLTLAGVVVVTGLLVLSHYWALWLLGATMLVLGWHAWRTRGDDRRRTVTVMIAISVGGLFLVPWLGVMLYQSAHTGTPWAAPVRPTTLVTQTLQDFGGGDFAEGLVLGWGLLMLFLLGLFGRAVDRRRIEIDVRTQPQVRHEAAVIALTIAIATAVGYLSSTTFATRYAAAFYPLFMLIAAVGLCRFSGRVARDLVAAGFLVLGLIGGVNNAITDRTQAGDVAAAIRAGAQPGDVVVMCPDQLGPAMHRLLPDSLGLTQLAYPTLGDPSFVDWREYAKRNAAADPAAIADEIVARAGKAHSVWLVVSGTYKTLEGQCEALDNVLGSALPGRDTVVIENGNKFFEHESLVRYNGPAS